MFDIFQVKCLRYTVMCYCFIILTLYFLNNCRMAINNIGDIGAASLAELLKTNHTLKDIR